ncbi:hypothetical protein [Legionella oakridgensis]|uniref:hypothetical protein n=1 Tax=Legionella oakridgensis TaxID=29423 RepID=UPI0003DDFED2|nr:hypothetical protein [Legionella oakridgensis]ETO92083.1 hypothetical protein LOR_35c02840 [Legionella oakridgensis RV-2-2007]
MEKEAPKVTDKLVHKKKNVEYRTESQIKYDEFYKILIAFKDEEISPEQNEIYSTVLRELTTRRYAKTGNLFDYKFIPRKKDSKEIYAALKQCIDSLPNYPEILKLLRTILTTPIEGIYYELTDVDSAVFARAVDSKLAELDQLAGREKSIHEHKECYILLVKAAFAFNFYIERAKRNHPLPQMLFPSWDKALQDYDDLLKRKNTALLGNKDTVGRMACDFFMMDVRVACPYNSVQYSFQAYTATPLLIGKILTRLNNNNSHQSFFDDLRRSIPNAYRPAYVKDLIAFLESNGIRIEYYFNPTGGWGERLLGAKSTDSLRVYTETDPNPILYEKKIEMLQAYSLRFREVQRIKCPVDGLGLSRYRKKPEQQEENLIWEIGSQIEADGKTFNLFKLPVEDLSESYICQRNTRYDLVFYSPPYYNQERYQDDDDYCLQSHARYAKFEEWRGRFLYSSITRGYNVLREGGIFAIHVAVVKKQGGIDLDLPTYAMDYINGHCSGAVAFGTYPYSDTGQAPSYVHVYKKGAGLYQNPGSHSNMFFRRETLTVQSLLPVTHSAPIEANKWHWKKKLKNRFSFYQPDASSDLMQYDENNEDSEEFQKNKKPKLG